jgi:hypothetical protein
MMKPWMFSTHSPLARMAGNHAEQAPLDRDVPWQHTTGLIMLSAQTREDLFEFQLQYLGYMGIVYVCYIGVCRANIRSQRLGPSRSKVLFPLERLLTQLVCSLETHTNGSNLPRHGE